MRVRAQDASGDYTFGQGALNFLVDSPAAVGQKVKTRLLLMKGEWFLDVNEGTPYAEEILGEHKLALYDMAIQQRVLQTQGVVSILEYSSQLDAQRALSVSMLIETRFGQTRVQEVF